MLLTHLAPSLPLTIPTITALTATIEKNAFYVRNNWWIAPGGLRSLGAAIGKPVPELRSLSEHALLAAHLTICTVLDLIVCHDGVVRCTEQLHDWFELSDFVASRSAHFESILRHEKATL